MQHTVFYFEAWSQPYLWRGNLILTLQPLRVKYQHRFLYLEQLYQDLENLWRINCTKHLALWTILSRTWVQHKSFNNTIFVHHYTRMISFSDLLLYSSAYLVYPRDEVFNFDSQAIFPRWLLSPYQCFLCLFRGLLLLTIAWLWCLLLGCWFSLGSLILSASKLCGQLGDFYKSLLY